MKTHALKMVETSKMNPTLGGYFLSTAGIQILWWATLKPPKAQAAWYVKVLGFLQNRIVSA